VDTGACLEWPECPPLTPLLPLQLLEGNFALFCTYTLGFRNEFQNILLAIMVRMAPLDPPGLGCTQWHPMSKLGSEGGQGLWGQ